MEGETPVFKVGDRVRYSDVNTIDDSYDSSVVDKWRKWICKGNGTVVNAVNKSPTPTLPYVLVEFDEYFNMAGEKKPRRRFALHTGNLTKVPDHIVLWKKKLTK